MTLTVFAVWLLRAAASSEGPRGPRSLHVEYAVRMNVNAAAAFGDNFNYFM